MRVFVGVPTFGRPEMLRRALTSIANQTFQDFGVLVSDNGNDPANLEVVRSFDERFEYVGQPKNLGLVGNWNFLRSLGNASLWAFLEDDNFWDAEHLKIGIDALDANPDVMMWHCPAKDWIDKPDRPMERRPGQVDSTGSETILELPRTHSVEWLRGSRCPSSSVIIRTSEIRRNVFDPSLPFSHDYLRWGQIGVRNPVLRAESSTCNYTYHDANAVTGLTLSRAAGTQMREVRRRLAEIIFEEQGWRGETLAKQVVEKFDAGEIGQLVPALLSSKATRELRIAGRYIWNHRPDAHAASGHMRAARRLGTSYFRFCDSIDHLAGQFAVMKKRVSG
jgi:hypothetical protein